MAIGIVTDLRNSQTTTDLSLAMGTCATNDVLVVSGGTEDSGSLLNTPTTAGTATVSAWTLQNTDTSASHVAAYQWTAKVTAGGTVTITIGKPVTTSKLRSAVGYLFPTADGYSLAGSPNKEITLGTSAQATQVGVSGSICVGLNGDWNGNDPSTNTYVGTATQDGTAFFAGTSTLDFWHQTLAGTSTTVGLSAPTGQVSTTAGIEILKSGAVAVKPSLLVTRAAIIRASTR